MSFFRRKPKTKGYIGYYGLADWWLVTFSEEERERLEAHYVPLGSTPGTLTQVEIFETRGSAGAFLSNLATWTKGLEDERTIALRILSKAETLLDPRDNVLDSHFAYQSHIEIWYRHRESVPYALDKAIEACHKQISIAQKAANEMRRQYPNSPLPSHVGYKQLTIIYDKLGRYEDAIRVAEQAKAQGWNGDWDKRIERYSKKSFG